MLSKPKENPGHLPLFHLSPSETSLWFLGVSSSLQPDQKDTDHSFELVKP